MPRFYLIDHSLRGLGGHHFEYAVHILRAAQRAGYEIAVATHRRFRKPDSWPRAWRVEPLFHHEVYSKHAVAFARRFDASEAGRATGGTAWGRVRDAVADWRQSWDRRRRLGRFATACRRLFRTIPARNGDVGFFATMSEFDLQAASQFLQQDPETAARVSWKLQFHRDIFAAPDASPEKQAEQLAAMRTLFQACLRPLPAHQLRLFCTTSHLATRYNQMDIGRFEELAYPVNPAFHAPHRPRRHAGPLRITTAGALRAEKGAEDLTRVAAGLWGLHLGSGRAQLRLQAHPDAFARLSESLRERTGHRGWDPRLEPLTRVDHPLEMQAYRQLILSSDIGLLLYDPANYFARCSGVLVEMLAAGVPVVAPAGCWLGDQLAEPNYEHGDALRRGVPDARVLHAVDLPWERSAASRGAICRCRRLRDATALLVRFRPSQRLETGQYLRLDARQVDGRDRTLRESSHVLAGRRSPMQPLSVVVQLEDDARQVRLQWRGGPEGGATEPLDLELCFLGTRAGRRIPSGSVGLVASNVRQATEHLAEMIDLHPHYRATARRFSLDWARRHSPGQALLTLTDAIVPARAA